jgi:phage-related protein
VVLAVIDVFLGALNAIIDVIQTLLEIAMAPVAAVESLLDAIF